jgi:cytochrome c oxidase subunit I
LLRTELLTPAQSIIDADTYNQIFTLHGAIMIFLFIIPSIPAALGNFFLPMMIGAKDVAFPRLNLASWWIYILGALFALYSIVSGAVDTGWTFYTPYSVQTGTAVVSMTLAVFILGFSSILTGINFIVTLHKLRSPGLSMEQDAAVPLVAIRYGDYPDPGHSGTCHHGAASGHGTYPWHRDF